MHRGIVVAAILAALVGFPLSARIPSASPDAGRLMERYVHPGGEVTECYELNGSLEQAWRALPPQLKLRHIAPVASIRAFTWAPQPHADLLQVSLAEGPVQHLGRQGPLDRNRVQLWLVHRPSLWSHVEALWVQRLGPAMGFQAPRSRIVH